MTNIIIDIETLPDQSEGATDRIAKDIKPPAQMKKPETIQAWHDRTGKYEGEKDKAIQEQYLKTSFNGGYGQICCICVDVDGVEHSFTTQNCDEKTLLNDFWATVWNNSMYFIAHNAKFDLPFLWHRCVVNGVRTPSLFKPHGRHSNDHFCTMEAWAGYNGKIKLDSLAKILGLGSKTEGMDGSQVWPEYQKGNIQKITNYCMDDVRLTKAIYERLTFQ